MSNKIPKGYQRCNECEGEGKRYNSVFVSDGYTSVWGKCRDCDGKGYVEIPTFFDHLREAMSQPWNRWYEE